MEKNLQEMIASYQRKTSELVEAQSDVKDILETLNTFFINQQQDFEKINQMIKKLNVGESEIVKFNCLYFSIFYL
jgi:ABC-type transporter Mla subunit MlaD